MKERITKVEARARPVFDTVNIARGGGGGFPWAKPGVDMVPVGDANGQWSLIDKDTLGGGAGVVDATYLVTEAHADLEAEVVVGATPGGELGGTWATPTVDATHSGSSHADVQAAAEATAQAALDAHTGDTIDAHDASAISVADSAAQFSGTDVETVLAEVQDNLDAHLADAVGAHASTAIAFTPAGTIAATDVQAAIEEVALEASGGTSARVIQLKVYDDETTVQIGDGQLIVLIDDDMNGYNLVAAHAYVTTVSSSGTPTIQVRNVTQAADMLSTRITIDQSEFSSYTAVAAPVIDTLNDDVAVGDRIAIDVDVAGTGAKGLGIILKFDAP